jgi:hypothetical protein
MGAGSEVSVEIALPRKPRENTNGARVCIMRCMRYGGEWTKMGKIALEGERIQETEMLFHFLRSSLGWNNPPFKSPAASSVDRPLMWSKSGMPPTEAQETLT